MIKYGNVYILFLMFAFYTSCNGQGKTDLPIETFSTESKEVVTSHGPTSIVRTIKQDRNGNIWLASWEGIFRYDGKSFTNITSKVSSARFFSLLEDRKGNFWFASIGSGVYYYDGKSFRNYTTKDGLAGDDVITIYEDKAGNIWFGTDGGASRYDGKSFRTYLMNEGLPFHLKSALDFPIKEGLTHNEQNGVQWIFEDKTGKIWFGTRGYARIYDGKKFTTITNKEGKPFKNVWCIIEDTKGNI